MKIEFDGIADLREFLEFAGYERAADRRAANVPAERLRGEATAPDAHLTTEERAAAPATAECPRAPMTSEDLARAIARTTGALPAEQGYASEGSTPVKDQDAPTKRKRRTKAEIEADKAAAEAAANTPAANGPTDAQAAAAMSPPAGANPFDASTSNEPAATAALNEAPAGATGTLAVLGSDVRAEAAVLGDGAKSVDPQAFIQLRVAEMGGTFDPREHMKKCVEFIGALGKAKYDEAFTLAGTSRAVASYTPADCAKHIAALEYLQIAG